MNTIKRILLSLLVMFLIISCTSKAEKLQTQKEIRNHKNATVMNEFLNKRVEQKEEAVNNYINSLSLQEKICQMFIENLEGNKQFVPVEKMSLVDSDDKSSYIIPGGYIYFGYNIADDRKEVFEFNKSIYEYCKKNNKIPPYLAVDQEGGIVSRLRKINTPLPSCKEIAEGSLEDCKKIYINQAIQMKELGFHMNLAPVVEIITEENKDFLDERSFGDKQKVISYGKECVKAYESNRIATVLKHFPGNTNTDPHLGLPVISLSKEDLFESLVSFKEILKENPTAILMSHAITTSNDKEPDTPSCLSSYWVNEILRNQYHYEGIVFSDDIFMGALKDNGFPPEVAVVKAITAGIDVIMISEKRIAVPVNLILEQVNKNPQLIKKIDESVKRIINYKIKAGILDINYQKDGCYKITISNQIYN